MDVTKKLNVSLEYEHRFDQYITTFDKAFFEPTISYDLTKSFSIGTKYRIMLDQNKKRKQKIKQRFSCYVKYDFNLDDFKIKVKTALQYGFDDLTNNLFSDDHKLINRNAFEIEYNWFGKKIKPFAEYEFYYHINATGGGIINQWRLKAGSGYRLTKSSEFSVYYAFENEFNVKKPVDSHIFGLGYSYSF